MPKTGAKGCAEMTVTDADTAKCVGSGALAVFATPSMTALMEKASCAAIADDQESGSTTVGTLLNIRHLSATPVGMKVRCESELVETDGKRLVFHVAAYDDCGLIGEGTHERFVVNAERFLSKTESKRNGK